MYTLHVSAQISGLGAVFAYALTSRLSQLTTLRIDDGLRLFILDSLATISFSSFTPKMWQLQIS